jgi:hypothetical protein
MGSANNQYIKTMEKIKTYKGQNYVNVTGADLKLGDTIISGDGHTGQVALVSPNGIWCRVTLVNHPYDTEVYHLKGENTIHLVVKDQAEWDARVSSQYCAYESLNS